MSATIATLDRQQSVHDDISAAARAERYLVLAGRLLFAAISLVAPISHFTPQTIGYAAQQGVPAAGLLVPASGLLALAGALSIAFGYRARIGAWLIVAFLVPVTITMHNFWAVTDPMMYQMQFAMFMKNLSMLGGALLIAHFGAGPLSLDAQRNAGVAAPSSP
jgi:putative oxidoreductase